jgi:hypothetical protein
MYSFDLLIEPLLRISILSITGENNGNIFSTATPFVVLLTVKVAPASEPCFLEITSPSKGCNLIFSFSPLFPFPLTISTIFTQTFTVSPALKFRDFLSSVSTVVKSTIGSFLIVVFFIFFNNIKFPYFNKIKH